MYKPRIDVFISSTSYDLPTYRRAAIDAILTAGLHPIGMEHKPVTGERSVDLCKQWVNECQVYIGIFAHRYGWRPDGFGGKSITELEYEWAGEVKYNGKPIPRLCFIMDDKYPWPVSEMELDARTDLEQFKENVKTNGSQVGFFTTEDNLKLQILAALAPYSLPTQMSNLDHYLRWLHRQSKRSGLLHVLVPHNASDDDRTIAINQVYTPLDTQRQVWRRSDDKILFEQPVAQKNDDNYDSSAALTVMEAANINRRLVLLGDPGSGKSTFLNFLALCLTGTQVFVGGDWLAQTQGWTHGALVPIMIALRDFAQELPRDAVHGTAIMLIQHLEHVLKKDALENSYQSLINALEDGQALILMDGLDEVPSERRQLIREVIHDFVSRFHVKNRYILTCRILSYTNPILHINGFAVETIAQFSREKISEFVRKWYQALQVLGENNAQRASENARRLDAAIGVLDIGSLASNPMLLTQMAIVHSHEGTLPREEAVLYAKCVEMLLLRWRRTAATNLLLILDIREADLYSLLYEIAYDAHDKQTEREGSADIPEARVIAIAKERLGDDGTKGMAFCNYVEKQAGLFISRGQDANGLRMFTFPHRSIQEFLAGCRLASERFYREAVKHALRGVKWRKVILLATGHLRFNKQDVAAP
ncbi:MAG: DUF4062 domain-containing protein, partial [Anaerolineae bacterium]|nr:DUF4062 domain-containing protein [Anaerolineae bacterium]